jgi:hypothetical protein
LWEDIVVAASILDKEIGQDEGRRRVVETAFGAAARTQRRMSAVSHMMEAQQWTVSNRVKKGVVGAVECAASGLEPSQLPGERGGARELSFDMGYFWKRFQDWNMRGKIVWHIQKKKDALQSTTGMWADVDDRVEARLDRCRAKNSKCYSK